jgi:hypothetical protein
LNVDSSTDMRNSLTVVNRSMLNFSGSVSMNLSIK